MKNIVEQNKEKLRQDKRRARETQRSFTPPSRTPESKKFFVTDPIASQYRTSSDPDMDLGSTLLLNQHLRQNNVEGKGNGPLGTEFETQTA